MTKARVVGAACILFIIAVVALMQCAQAQTVSVQGFFMTLVNHYNPSTLPKVEDVAKVTNQIPNARPEEIIKALPAIMAVFAHRDETVKAYACTALFEIGRRPDSAELLRNYIELIVHDFKISSNLHIRAGEMVILGSLKPTPPEVLLTFLALLKGTDADAQVLGGSAIFELIQIAPENPEVIAAIREFLSRPLDNTTRIGALNALGNPHVKDVGLIAMVVASLDDSDQGVRFTGIEVLGRMGKNALLQAEPALQRLANDPKQPANVSAAAKEALKGIPGRTN